MNEFLEKPELLISEFKDQVKIIATKAYITVGIEIQKAEIEGLKTYRRDLSELKKQFVENGLEEAANLVYCIDTGLDVLVDELQMLVNIKEDKMNEAWDCLVRAQIKLGTVIRNTTFDEAEFEHYGNKLLIYENLLFPRMMFFSTGGIVKVSRCSICGKDFNECDHEKGKLYMGELCCRLIVEQTLEEVSSVTNPANKLCRAYSFQYNGKEHDVMTLREKDTRADARALGVQ